MHRTSASSVSESPSDTSGNCGLFAGVQATAAGGLLVAIFAIVRKREIESAVRTGSMGIMIAKRKVAKVDMDIISAAGIGVKRGS